MAQGNSQQNVNVKKLGGIAISLNTGVRDTGTQRVTIATNDIVPVSLAAETTKVIGTVNIAAAQTIAVTNAGTFAVQATPVTQLDTFMLGGVNVKEINAVTPLMGNGTTGTGSLRVTIASDNTAFSVNATLAAETTKVIGTVRNLGNIGAIFDGVNTAATAPANGILGLGIYNSTEPSPTTGQSVGIQLDSKGRQRMVIMDAAGNTRGVNVNASSQMSVSVDNTVTVASHAITIASGGVASGAIASGAVASGAFASGSIASGAIASGAIAAGAIATGATSIAANEDDASANLDTGVKILFVQQSTPADTGGTNGDYVMPQMSAGRIWTTSNIDKINAVTPLMGNGVTGTGSLRVTLASDGTAISTAGYMSVKFDQTTPGTTNAASISHIGATAVVNGGLAGSLAIGGATATNVAITDNPINTGAQAVSSENSAATTARKVQLVADLVGKLIVLPYANPENFLYGVTAAITDTTGTAVLASAGGSLRNYVTSVAVFNSHATVSSVVEIRDGTTTVMWRGYALAAGGGFTISFPTPLRGTAATAVNAYVITTGSNVYVSATGYKGV